jgi:hypothetical protein
MVVPETAIIMNRWISFLKFSFNAVLFITCVILTLQVIVLARQNQLLKIDLSEINHIRYGLLNVSEWSDQIASVMTAKINEFEITPENRDQFQKSIENVMYELIDDVEDIMKERTSGAFKGVKRWVAGFAIDVEQLRDSVPSFANTVIEELKSPETKSELKRFVLGKLDQFSTDTYNEDKMELFETLLLKYGCDAKPACQDILYVLIDEKQDAINYRVMLILFLVLLIFLFNLLARGMDRLQAPMLILSSFCLLLGGITMPMIVLEARIDLLLFKLLGQDVMFRDQIIFFQSKSITNVVRILMEDGSLQMILVGVLIFTFSIIFPSLKLISSYIYSTNLFNWRDSMVIKFFVIKSGKWSMADVMVVAFFMAYIGFNGVVSSQLDSIGRNAQSIEIFTTNGTQLMGGFYLFLSFCISSLILSEILTRKTKNEF